ncbi:MAG TPA: glutamate-5-semialdehyde dehydrogenase [Clostridiales bacterium]|nr:glutamate-5-semialdehyde dehydrogenase [Clostridiales bacterium]
MTTAEILENAGRIKNTVALMSTEQKNAALIKMAEAIDEEKDAILRANSVDLSNMQGIMSDVMLDRLTLTEQRIRSMAENMRALAKVPDPIGVTLDEYETCSGLRIKKVSVPIGVIALIYECRPNVTADAAAMTLKTGNVCILKIGKEAYGSARAIVSAMRKGLKRAGVSQNVLNLIEDTSRNAANELMAAVGYVDLLIPRGGKGLIDACVKNAKVPCIQTGTGICHVYVDEYADIEKALNIIENAKCSRPSVCNAMEVLLLHKNIAVRFLPVLYKRLVSDRKENPVKLKLDNRSFEILGGRHNCFSAEENDFDTEFLDYVMAIKIVDSVKDAALHISAHSTGHSDCIVTENEENSKSFTRLVDSAAVYVNASTRFTDGGEFGMCGEIGISTQKLHARGPMGLKELTSYKYVIVGNGNVR